MVKFGFVFSKISRLIHNKVLHNSMENIDSYNAWRKKHEEKRTMISSKFSYQPKISVLMPVYNVDVNWLMKAVESVEKQRYSNWELCIVDDCSSNKLIREYLLMKESEKIKVKFLEKNSHISITSNEAFELSTGEFIALLDHDDEIHENALLEVVTVLNHDNMIDLIYSDEDKLSMESERMQPAFKTHWNSELLFSFMYVGHLGVYRRRIVEEIGGFRVGFEGAQDYDLILRFTEKTNRVYHIPKILYHWRMIPGSTAVEVNSKSYAYDRGRIALYQSLLRRGHNCSGVEEDPFIRGNYRPLLRLNKKNPIAIFLIALSNNKSLIQERIRDIESLNTDIEYDIIVFSTDPIDLMGIKNITYSYNKLFVEMYKYLINFEHIESFVFIKDTIAAQNSNWLEGLLVYSERDDVGCVSGKIVSQSGKISYSGSFIENGCKIYPNFNDNKDEFGYLGRIRRVQNVTFASSNCFSVRSTLFKNYMLENLSLHDFDGFNLYLITENIGNIYNPYFEFVTSNMDYDNDGQLAPHGKELLVGFEEDRYLNPNTKFENGKILINI
ncbi:glycosyltransferase [Paenibacillus amylolyticus]|uniref:Glycosyltransferase n=1 Tax=Paenibacillus amylolyticus TaxID=1451 RepID=A0A5M9WVS9_PAEAM|nr:glycosyltransferase [Paenibacillus amylolyticus]KAA8785642.1 glycosyltransferase [Paenibacillus amylolyticus]MDP9702720.1 glycosyltransferase involved in cell wall biosynthesis [Paenibacillus intestini]